MREKYEALSLVVLKDLAKARNIKHVSTMKKKEVIEALLAEDEKEAAVKKAEEAEKSRTEKSAAGAEGTGIERNPAGTERSRVEKGAAGTERSRTEKSAAGTERSRTEKNPAGTERRRIDKNPAEAERSRTERNTGGTERSRTEKSAAGTERARGARSSAGPERSRIERTPSGPERIRAERSDHAAIQAASEKIYGEQISFENERAVPENAEISAERSVPDRAAAARGTGERASKNQSENFDRPPMDLASLDSGVEASGILEVMADGYGFIRSDNYLPGENDVYVAPSQIRRFGLKTGDIICGNTRIRAQQEKFSALLYLKTINGYTPSEAAKRYNFEDMTPVFPDKRMKMERSSREIASRVVDLFSPIGKGQRGMIVSPPKAGKTTLLKDVARSILQNEKDMYLLILLIDERPEEVTDIREAIVGDKVEVIYSTFDELPDHHKRVSEMGIERAKRLVEHGKDVTILLDSITRLARAYNLTVPPSGRTLSGGLDPAALHMPKRFFGAARNMREGGSLTILATALVDTGSKMDDVVYEEFKGTGNMELVLDRKLSERRIFPAIDIQKSSTRREDLLLTPEEQEAMFIMRKALNGMKSEEAVENILNMFVHTRDNAELVARVRRQRYV